MAIAGKYNFKLQRGSDDSRSFALTAAGAPMDLTNWSPRMQIRTEEGFDGTSTSTSLLLDLNELNGLTIDADPTTGVIHLTLSAAQTITINPNNQQVRLSFGLELFAGAPETVLPILQGFITVYPEVVR